MVLDGSASKSIEMVAESTFNTFPTNPTMLGFGGYANPVSIKKTTVTDKFPYLKGATGTNKLQATKTQKVSEAFAIDVELRPTSWSILPYVLCAANATTYAIGDTVHDLAFGVKIGSEYEKITGACLSKYEISMEEEKTAVAKLTAMAAATSGFSGTDYIGTGAHAADPSGAALKFGDLSSITYDSAALSTEDAHLDSVKFGIENKVTPIKDLSSTATSKIAAWGFGQRNISLELGLSLDAMDLAADMLAGSAHTFAFTALSKTFTFSNIIWDGDFDQKLDADDILGMTLKASNVDLAIA